MLLEDLQTIPDKISEILANKERLQWFASKYAGAQDMFFIGRGIDYATSMKGSLKLKEISYIHSEAYAAGELKHGEVVESICKIARDYAPEYDVNAICERLKISWFYCLKSV